MNVYGSKCYCKKHERFHLVEEPCPYCVDNTQAKEDPAYKAKQEEMERMLQWWVLT